LDFVIGNAFQKKKVAMADPSEQKEKVVKEKKEKVKKASQTFATCNAILLSRFLSLFSYLCCFFCSAVFSSVLLQLSGEIEEEGCNG
jgi:hypothetical protein